MTPGDIVKLVRYWGPGWTPSFNQEGPRRPGHCVYCNGQCLGADAQCQVRVWEESMAPNKRLITRGR